MAKRVIVRLYLPLEMGAVGRILKAVAREFPEAQVAEASPEREVAISADPDAFRTQRHTIRKSR